MIATRSRRLCPCSQGRATRRDYTEYCPTSGYVGNQRRWPYTGSRNEITFNSASMHDSNVISSAQPMFSESGHTAWLMARLSDVQVYRKSKMAAMNRKWTGNNVFSARIQDSKAIPTAIPTFSGVVQHRDTSRETAQRPGMSEIEDGGLNRKLVGNDVNIRSYTS